MAVALRLAGRLQKGKRSKWDGVKQEKSGESLLPMLRSIFTENDLDSQYGTRICDVEEASLPYSSLVIKVRLSSGESIVHCRETVQVSSKVGQSQRRTWFLPRGLQASNGVRQLENTLLSFREVST